MNRYLVFYKGRFLDVVEAKNDGDAKINIASNLSAMLDNRSDT